MEQIRNGLLFFYAKMKGVRKIATPGIWKISITYDTGDYKTRKLITPLDEFDNWIAKL